MHLAYTTMPGITCPRGNRSLPAALGVPVGVGILTWANPAHVRMGVGAFLVLSTRCCGRPSPR
jgi:hypothetical protein